MSAPPIISNPLNESELELWTAFKNERSTVAREALFSSYAPFARSIAMRLFRERSRGDMDSQDVCQLAYAGLLEALDRFEPNIGTPFRAFAAHRIAGSIRDGIPQMSELREQMSWRHRLHRDRLDSIKGGKERHQEAIDNLTDLVIGLALGFMLEDAGLLQTDDAITAHAGRQTAYDTLAWKDLVNNVRRGLETLPERERTILEKHYLDHVNFDTLASLLRISKGRVSQLHRDALSELREHLARRGLNRTDVMNR